MNFKKYYRCFSEDELVRGAELLLSGEAKTSMKNCKESDLAGSGILYGCADQDENGLHTAGEERFYKLSSSTLSDQKTDTGKIINIESFLNFNHGQDTATKKTYHAEICFDKKNELVLSAKCDCPDFQKDHYGCAHLAAALTGFYMNREGEDFFRNTRLEEALKELSGTDDPFAPGVMKRTDSRLRDFLMTEPEENSLPVWEDTEEGTVSMEPQLRCECSIMQINDDMYLEIKAGAQRTYLIKDIPFFLETYRKGGLYTFGKNEYVLCEENFQKESRPLIQLLLKADQLSGEYSSRFVSIDGSRNLRYLKLDDFYCCSLIEMYNGSELIFSNGEKVPVQLERVGLEVTLRKKQYGASLKLKPVEVFCSTLGKQFLRDDKGIFLVEDYGEGGKMLGTLLTSSTEAYIRESDLPVFLAKYLPFFKKHSKFIIKGIQPDHYKKEVPEYILYLDLEDPETISCQPYSVYSDPEVRYPLFDSQTGTLRRNGPAETAFARKLTGLFDVYNRENNKLYVNRNEEELFRFLQKEIPDLSKVSTLYISDRLKRIKVRKLPAMQIEVIRQASSLLMNIRTNDMSPEEMQAVFNAYSLKKKYFRLKDGSFFDFEDTDTQVWETLSDLYRHYGKKDPSLLAVPLYRTLYLEEMLEGRKDLVLKGDEHYRSILGAAKDEDINKIKVPESLKGILRPYQEEGFRWISRLKKMGFGGILADDMGLGKTLQVLTFLLAEKLARSEEKQTAAPSLIICPASLVYNWKKEMERFTPQLNSVIIVGSPTERQQIIESSREADVWITSYDLLKRDIAWYEGITFSHEFIDEAQYIKNQATQAAKSVRAIEAEFRMALTGTPIENRLSELWSIMDYLMPGFFYPYTRFQKEFEIPISQDKDSQSLDRLRHMVHPFILRRMKSDVLKELPEKQEETISIRLEGEQRRIYDAYAQKLRRSLEKTSDQEFGSSKIQILAEITRLRQLCCDPALVIDDYPGENAKLEACMELVKQAVDGGHKLLLFSQFTSMLDIICQRLAEEKLPYYRIDGSTKKEKRMEMVDNFAGDDVPVFCISLKAGGTGINLTAADIVIHYDPWWNQAAQNQATDRAHRIGQANKVTVYELVARDTLEEKILDIKHAKTKLMKDVLSGDSISSSDFNRNELIQLL